MSLRRITLSLVAFALVASVASAESGPDEEWAEQHGIDDKYGVKVGGFLMNYKTITELGGVSVGTRIDLERDLDFVDNEVQFRASGHYRLGRKHRIDAAFLRVSRNSNPRLTAELEFGDKTFVLDEVLDAESSLRFFDVAYRYSVVESPRFHLGVSLGLSVAQVKTALSVQDREVATEIEETDFPIPLAGLHFGYTVRPGTFLNADFQWIDVTLGDIEARFVNTQFTFEHYFTRNIGLGFGYKLIHARYIEAKNDREFLFDMKYDGMLFYLSLSR